MSIRDIIDKFDSIRVNTVTLEQKIQWIEDLENIARLSILNNYCDSERKNLSIESLGDDIIIQPPFHRLYILYMLAMLSFDMDSNEEYNSYIDAYNYEMANFMEEVRELSILTK